MKINPPKVKIDPEKPFEDALFGREEFAKSLTSLLRNAEENLVIFVNAPWGAGKTTFSEMWRAYLQQQELEVIYYDAYAADYFDDPFVSFSGEILKLVDRRLTEGKGLIERREFKKTAIEVGKRLAGLAIKVGALAATLNAVKSEDVDELKEIGSDVVTGVSEIGADVIEKRIEHYAEEKDGLVSFKKSLAKLAAKVKEEQGFPLTIIVDELDRCRPNFALGLLERVKHLFDVEGVAFVLLVNREQIESYIQTVYGNEDTRDYLQKFGSLFIDLPNRQESFSNAYVNGHREYCAKLLSHYGFSNQVQDGRFLVVCMGIFSAHYGMTLREIERAFAVLALYYSSVVNARSADIMLVALLAVLKIKRSTFYKALSSGRVPANSFYRDSTLDQLKVDDNESFSWAWAREMLDFCLMSDTELANALTTNTRDGLTRLNQTMTGGRNRIIPRICFGLDQFSLRPPNKPGA